MTTSDYILAKPSGVTLEQHSEDVMSEALSVCQRLQSTCEKYRRLTGKDLTERLRVSAKLHDNGKKEQKWQDACRKDYLKFLYWKKEHPELSFKEYSIQNHDEAGFNLRNVGIRHEMYSIIDNASKTLPFPLSVAIVAHHGKLGFDYEEKWMSKPAFQQYWEKVRKTSNDISEEESLSLVCNNLLEFDAIRGLLQFADHRASAKEVNEFVYKLTSFSYHFPFPRKRGIQKLVEDNWNNDILLVRAPTGAGKTDASLLWASRQISAHKADRLIIAMPTRFTANALSVNVAETLSDTGIYHSSAWYAKYTEVKNGNLKMAMALAQHKMARVLATPITICTIDHLLMALTYTREEHHLICNNLANSCVVIDEADFYDDFTLANILFLLRILHCWNVPIMIMSASLPETALAVYRKAGFRIEKILEDKKSDNYKKTFLLKRILNYESLEDIGLLFEQCIEKGNAIVYMNTVDKAIKAYKYIIKQVQERGKDIPVILYHSRYTELDKQNKEKVLLKHLGRVAWHNGTAKGIAILTQIGEVSINISSELMITEICPIDRLIQRAGRLCRFDNTVGDMYVVTPYKNGTIYPAPYGSYTQKNKRWDPCQVLLATKDKLKVGVYSAQNMVNILNEVYSSEIVFSTKALYNAKMLEQMFLNNWLINPMEKWQEDDTHSNNWSSRDITTQGIVFVCKPKCGHFFNYSDYMEFVLTKSISIPVYLIEKGRKDHLIDLVGNITIGTHKPITINIIREGFYDTNTGLDFTKIEEDNFL